MSCSTSPSAIVLVAFGHHFLDPQVAEADHQLKRARVQVVADQHARLELPQTWLAGFAAAAQVGAVHDVVMQQRRRVDELDDSGGLDVPVAA